MKAFLFVVLLVGTAAAQYYNSEQYPTSNGAYYYPNPVDVAAPSYQPAQPPVHYQPFTDYKPVSSDSQWQTVRDVRHQSPSGEYAYEYETQNGIIASEQSYIAGPNQAQRKTGFYQYPSPDGTIVRVDYVADENGFQASGNSLPKTEPIPEAIATSIEYNLKQADRQYLQEAYGEQGY